MEKKNSITTSSELKWLTFDDVMGWSDIGKDIEWRFVNDNYIVRDKNSNEELPKTLFLCCSCYENNTSTYKFLGESYFERHFDTGSELLVFLGGKRIHNDNYCNVCNARLITVFHNKDNYKQFPLQTLINFAKALNECFKDME